MLLVILDMLVGTRQISEASKATAKAVKVPTFKGTSFKVQMDEKYPWIHATACKVAPGDISDQVPPALLSPILFAMLTTN